MAFAGSHGMRPNVKKRRDGQRGDQAGLPDVPQQQPEEQPGPGYPEDRIEEERRQFPGADLPEILGEQGQDRVDGEDERMDDPGSDGTDQSSRRRIR